MWNKVSFAFFYISLLYFLGLITLLDAGLVDSLASLTSPTLDKLNLNVWENSGLYQGDIYRRPGETEEDEQNKWPLGVVPYIIKENQFTPSELSVLMAAIEVFHNKTCIRFIPFKEEHQNWIEFGSQNPGCYSLIGMRNGSQEVNLETPACLQIPGTAEHELLHVLGFPHQQSSYNRDDYVRINFENIKPAFSANFDKLSENYTKDFTIGYDYNSIMHYGAYAFSANNKTTIDTLEPNVEIGQRETLSEKDILKLQMMYKKECRVAEILLNDDEEVEESDSSSFLGL